jgi:hypothetical protein
MRGTPPIKPVLEAVRHLVDAVARNLEHDL